MRDRLVELIQNAHDEQKYLTSDKSIQAIADYLLANGVIVLSEANVVAYKKEIAKGTKVIVTNTLGEKYKGVVVSVNDFREPSMKYAVDIGFDDYVFVGDEMIEPTDKHDVTDKFVGGKEKGGVE